MMTSASPDGPSPDGAGSSLTAGLAGRLLAWYDRHRRDLPWRARPGESADPYRVWLSEIMLQQTTVATVKSYFADFTGRWPTVEALAAADLDAVLHAWQGLGYYARARNLHACARQVAAQHGGRFPDTEAGLAALPGVGAYTAAAVAAIAFGRPATPVDGNIARVMARFHALETPLPTVRAEAGRHAARLTPAERPGDFAQAMMDLGATVCTPRRPACPLCPWMDGCAARKAGRQEDYPRRAAKRARPLRHGVVFWTQREDGAVLVRRRPESGLLGGMAEFPSTDWREEPWRDAEARLAAPAPIPWRPLPGAVEHGFTHFSLKLTVWRGRIGPEGATALGNERWCRIEALDELALPTLMRKVARHAMGTVPGVTE